MLRKTILLSLGILMLLAYVGCSTAPVRPQTVNEAFVVAAASVKEVADAHRQFTADAKMYYELGVFTREQKDELAALSREALKKIQQAQADLEVARRALDIQSMRDIDEISVPKAREILHEAIMLYIRYGGKTQ